MAELLIRTVNKPLTGNPDIDRHRTMRGSVVVIVPDGHTWGSQDIANPDWMILRLPGVSPELLAQFVGSDAGYGSRDAELASRTLRRRAFRLDLVALKALTDDPATLRDLLTQPAKAVTLVLGLVRAAPVIDDPAVIGGGDSRVIG